jgi:TPP-dependent pyruvate/acetoin dehydrogenase alpha subunit
LNANTANATTAALPRDLSADELVRLYEQMLLLRRFAAGLRYAREGEENRLELRLEAG